MPDSRLKEIETIAQDSLASAIDRAYELGMPVSCHVGDGVEKWFVSGVPSFSGRGMTIAAAWKHERAITGFVGGVLNADGWVVGKPRPLA
jgi:hypothetical protein